MFIVSHPFRKERGKNGAPSFICDVGVRSARLGHPPTEGQEMQLSGLLKGFKTSLVGDGERFCDD
jgi:hypothetical protein